MNSERPRRILIVTGMSGAGKSTALRTLEDLGWEVIDNLPLSLLDRLLGPADAEREDARPIAIGLDSRTRGFDTERILRHLDELQALYGSDSGLLFLDCSGRELERRFSETRRRHPLAADRPVADGIAREREMLRDLRQAATHLINTSDLSTNALQQELRARFGRESEGPQINVMSFGFARGLPRTADLVFDMRFLRNPHWVPELKPRTGLDPEVAAYVAGDPAYEDALTRIEGLLLTLLPRYASEGKSYVTIAFGCTGGKHRSVHICEAIVDKLRKAGFSPTVSHRDVGAAAQDGVLERKPDITTGDREL